MTMKLKLFLSVLLLFAVLKINADSFPATGAIFGKVEISLYPNDIPFDILNTGEDDDFRSVVPLVPISVSLDDSNHLIEVDFMKGVGEIEIVISQNGIVVYSSSENVLSSLRKNIQLDSYLLGNFLIEIKGENGACVCGYFVL